MIIRTRALTKSFGARKAVDEVDLAVAPGICFGFLGPNGAGKTTLIRLLLGLARPTSGSVEVRGADVHRDGAAALAHVGAIVEEPRFYPYLTGIENLRVHAALVGDAAAACDRIPALLSRVGLEARGGERVKDYSMGMRQRLGVARALLDDPELLVLDEPSNGLDAGGMADFRTLIRGLVEEEGRTVFLSSHLLDEVEKLCDRVAIVDHGRVVVEGALADLLAAGGGGIEIDCDTPDRARELLAAQPGVTGVELRGSGTLLVHAAADRTTIIELNRVLVAGGVGVAGLRQSGSSLEERFLAITAGSTPSSPPGVGSTPPAAAPQEAAS